VLLQRSRSRAFRRGPRLYHPAVWTLEDRMLLSSGPAPELIIDPAPIPAQMAQLDPCPSLPTAILRTISSPTGGLHPLSAVPALSSLPGAPASLYLNFVGDSTPSYGTYSNIITPAFDQDGDPTTFSDSELAAIQKAWSCVAEDYAPFNINVTTVPPANMAHGATEKVDIGGDGAWTGGRSGGLCYVNDFTMASVPNIAFVFSQNLAGGNARDTGDAASHESGHGFGLNHQSTYSGTNLVQEYSTGPGDGTAPLMGSSYGARRSLWWYGPSDAGSTAYQDDMAIISRPTNGFGYRAEPADSTPASAFPLVVQNGTQVSATGLIIHPSDQDYDSFTSGPGVVTFTVSVPADVSDLAPRVELLDASGSTVIASAGPSASDFSASITATLPAAGTYRILVTSSDGHYGNVGHYSISGTISATASPGSGSGSGTGAGTGTGTSALNAPAAVSASAVSSGRIDLTWAAVPVAQGFQIERANSQGSWAILGTTTAGITVFSDVSVAPGTTYSYRVRAIGSGQTSSPSAVATAATPPAPSPPVGVSHLTVVSKAPRQVVLTWTPGSSGAQGYTVERSTNGKNWTVVGRASASSLRFTDSSVAPGKTYVYRVRAYNSWGFSKPSPVTRLVTPRAALPALRKKLR
jgi:Fibronectin type III domain